MDLSGVIFVVLAVAWAVYLIPKALQHHDEVARTRSIDRFSTAMRVLARREPVNHRDSRLVITPARSADNPRLLLPTQPGSAATAAPARRPETQRAATRAAARRRRRILGFLLLCTGVVAGLAGFVLVPWWSVGIPAGITVLFLLLCRTQVKRQRTASWDADLLAAAAEEVVAVRRTAARVEAPYGTPLAPTARNAEGFEELDADDTMAIQVPVLDAVAVPTADGGTLWDPLPVTLPTYVTKAKAKRTVRTIDLGEPGTWTSGRTAEDAALAAQASAPPAETDEDTARAVGS